VANDLTLDLLINMQLFVDPHSVPKCKYISFQHHGEMAMQCQSMFIKLPSLSGFVKRLRLLRSNIAPMLISQLPTESGLDVFTGHSVA